MGLNSGYLLKKFLLFEPSDLSTMTKIHHSFGQVLIQSTILLKKPSEISPPLFRDCFSNFCSLLRISEQGPKAGKSYTWMHNTFLVSNENFDGIDISDGIFYEVPYHRLVWGKSYIYFL